MNNNFYEIPNDWYSEFNNTFMNNMMGMPSNNIMNNGNMVNMNNDLSDPKTGFIRGNLFDNLYDPYKNYKNRELKPKNQREELLYNIMMHIFVLTELQLYLDTNPGDMRMLDTYKKYLTAKRKLVEQYENSFGPLTMDGVNDTNRWTWVNGPWPWEMMK